MIDPEDIAYEDSVSSDTYDESLAEWEYEDEMMAGGIWADPCISYEEDSRDYEMLYPDDCAAEMMGE